MRLIVGPALLIEPRHRLGDELRSERIARSQLRGVAPGALDDVIGVGASLAGSDEFLLGRLARIGSVPLWVGEPEFIEFLPTQSNILMILSI